MPVILLLKIFILYKMLQFYLSQLQYMIHCNINTKSKKENGDKFICGTDKARSVKLICYEAHDEREEQGLQHRV